MSRFLTGLLLAGLLAGCQVEGNATLPPVIPLSVQITPSLGWLKPAMADCAEEIPSLSLTVQTSAQADQSLDDADILLRWSDSFLEEGQTFKLGEDHLVIIVNPNNALEEMDGSQLAAVFSGSLTDWSSVSEGAAGSIQPWVYPAVDDGQMLFSAKVLPLDEIIGTARIAPSPDVMLEAVNSDPQAVGLIPARWLNPSVKAIEISGYTNNDWTLPVLAVTKVEPSGPVRDWLLCVQEKVQP